MKFQEIWDKLGVDHLWERVVSLTKQAKELKELLPAEDQERINQIQRDLRDKRDDWRVVAEEFFIGLLVPEKYEGILRFLVELAIRKSIGDKINEELDKLDGGA